jgi:hypothetical protein
VVIVDAASPLAVAETIALLSAVDGVIVVSGSVVRPRQLPGDSASCCGSSEARSSASW